MFIKPSLQVNNYTFIETTLKKVNNMFTKSIMLSTIHKRLIPYCPLWSKIMTTVTVVYATGLRKEHVSVYLLDPELENMT